MTPFRLITGSAHHQPSHAADSAAPAVLSGSLALLSDAGHMLSDVGAVAAALWAARPHRR